MKVTLAEMITALQKLRQEMGRIPSRPEFHQKTGWTIEQLLDANDGSGYHKLVELSGLKYAAKGKRDKQELRKQHFEAVKAEAERLRVPTPPKLVRNLLIIPDLHAPYHHPDAIPFLEALHKKYKFDHVVNVGDEIDGHAISFHTHDPDLLSPGHELDAAIKALQPLYKLFPEMDLAESNHGALVYRRGKHFGLPRHVLKPYREVLCAPQGWRWQHEVSLQLSSGQRLIVHHSYGANALKAAQHRGVCMAFGHHHGSLSIQYWRSYEGLMFAIFASSLTDGNHLAAEYGKNFPNRPIQGAVRITDGIPHLLPMFLDAGCRWNGVLP